MESSCESSAVVKFCYCGLPSIMKTSWSADNLGRRFRGCPLYGNLENVVPCRYFDWVEPTLSSRARIVVVGLLKKIREMERKEIERIERERTEMEMKKRKERIRWILWFIVAMFIGWMMK